jgi:hypothetical protein
MFLDEVRSTGTDIILGNTFTSDGHPDRTFDYMLSNPPFGVEWRKVEADVRAVLQDPDLRKKLAGAGLDPFFRTGADTAKLLRADVLHDVGRSLNPAVDVGQVEGAFIQGMGWLTTEELVWHPQTGKLTTHAPSTYKIPTANDCPPVFNVRLFEGDNYEDSIHRSKAVGEPPLLLPFSVFFAIRDAVSAAGEHRANPPLQAPATSEAILRAVEAVQGHTG